MYSVVESIIHNSLCVSDQFSVCILGLCVVYPLALHHHSLAKPCVSVGTLARGGVDVEGCDKGLESITSLHAWSVFVGNLPMTKAKRWLRWGLVK